MEHKAKIAGIALLCIAFASESITLGRARGVALIGRPLDMVVPVQMAAGEDSASLCFEADVFHGDLRQDASRVKVTVETSAQPQTANVRVTSASAVDEPVVTVYLRTGCSLKTTRRYVFLADLSSEITTPPAPLVVPVSAVAMPLPVVKMDPGTEPVAPVAKTRNVRESRKSASSDVTVKRTAAKPGATKYATSDEKSPTVQSSGQSRLKLDPLEFLSDRVAGLDSFMTFAPTEDALRNIARAQTMEGDIKSLRAMVAKSDASIAELKTRLQEAESERTPAWLLYGLIALVLACLGAVALLWRRQRQRPMDEEEWWGNSRMMSAAGPSSLSTPAPAPVAMPHPSGFEPASVVPRKAPDAAVVVPPAAPVVSPSPLQEAKAPEKSGFVDLDDLNFDNLMQSGAAHHPSREQSSVSFTPSAHLTTTTPHAGLARDINSELMLDIRQQAEFFVSLGQTDRAVRILKKQISESEAPNPHIYLDLLSIFHSLSLKVDFKQLRDDFNRLFSGRIPEFALFKDEGRDLESYPDVLAHIVSLWPRSKVLDAIGMSIFQDPRAAGSQTFDLAAFRDLLLLYAVAQSVVPESPPDTTDATVRLEPLPVAAAVDAAAASPPTYFSNSGFIPREPVSAPEPDLSLDVLPEMRVAPAPAVAPAMEVQTEPKPPVQALDLDLSDSAMDVIDSHLSAAASGDFPMLAPREPASEAAPAVALPAEDGYLLNFDLPEFVKRPRAVRKKPVP